MNFASKMLFSQKISNALRRCDVLHLQFRRRLATKLTTPVKRYNMLLNEGVLKPDRSQFLAILKLQDLFNELGNYSLSTATSTIAADTKEETGWNKVFLSLTLQFL